MKLLAPSIMALALLAPAVTALETEAQRELRGGQRMQRNGRARNTSNGQQMQRNGRDRNTSNGSPKSELHEFLNGGGLRAASSTRGNTIKSFGGGRFKLQDTNPEFFKDGHSKELGFTKLESRQQCSKQRTAKKVALEKRNPPRGVRKQRMRNQMRRNAPQTGLEIRGGNCVSDHKCAEIRGDPHVKTFDGVSYDCQGEGEFVLAKSLETAFEIQGRFGPPDNGSDKAVTITKAISIDSGVEGAPQLDLYAAEVDGTCIINYYVNGELVLDWGDGLQYPGLEFMEDVDAGKANMDYAYFTESGLMYSVLVKSGSFGCVLNSKICLPPAMVRSETIIGLLGSPNDNRSDDWMTRTGGSYALGESKGSEPYNYCTSQHCVMEAEDSIFGYEDGTSFDDFHKCGDNYDGSAEEMIANPTLDCETCCDRLKEQTDSYESCLLECMEGGEEDCVAEIVNEEVLAEAQNKCPDSRRPPPGRPAPPKEPTPTPICRATGNSYRNDERKRMFTKEIARGAYQLNKKGRFSDVLPATEIAIAGKVYIVTADCKVEEVDESVDTPSIDTPSFDTPSVSESSGSSEEEEVPICKFDKETKTYSLQMGSAELHGSDAMPGEEIRVDGGGKAVLTEECALDRIVLSESSEEEEKSIPICKYEGSDTWVMGGSAPSKMTSKDTLPGQTVKIDGGTAVLSDTCEVVESESEEDRQPKCESDSDCPQPRCQANFPCFSFTCNDGKCFPKKEPPADSPSPDDPPAPDSPSPEDRTTVKAFTKGDPHFKTFGGELYDYHGECDLVLLHNPDFKEGLGMDIHIRTKIQDFWSSVESAAIKLGDETMEIRADPSSDEWLWFNGKEATSAMVDGEWYKHEMAGFLVRYKQTGENTREANLYLKGAKEVLVMKTFKSFVRIDVNWQESDNYFNSNGLLGDHAHDGKRLGRHGEFIEDVKAFGQEWQVVPEVDGSLFHSYEGAVVGKQCVMPPSYQPGMNVSSLAEQRRRLGESTLDTEMAEKACNHLVDPEEIKACVFDVIATQDLNMASTW